MPQTPTQTPRQDAQDTVLRLLVRVNRLLEEAEAVRILRDRLIAVASEPPVAGREVRS